MHPTLAGYLAPLRSHLVPALCSEPQLRELIDLAATLPAVPAGGFERRLGSHDSGLDLAICVRSAQPAARELQEGGYGGEAVRELLAATQDPRAPLHGKLDTFWLEYDTSRGGRVPSLFVGPRGDDPCEAVLRATELVRGVAVDDAVARELRRLAAPLRGVQLFQAGWMLGRARPGLRLCFAAHDLASFHRLLDRLASAEQRTVLREHSSRYASHITQFVLGVDISEGEVGPRVGLELGYQGVKQAVPIARWLGLLLALEQDGLCTTADRDALLHWPGRMSDTDEPDRWPAHLRTASTLLGPYAIRIDRVLHHIKLVVERDAVTEAKVYFGILQGWALA
jgi:hypothetical protein